jgi:ribonuclease HI
MATRACGTSDKPIEAPTHIEIYTDGSCIGNPGYGGYGMVTLRKDKNGAILKKLERKEYTTNITTNVRMEMTAVCAALENLGSVTAEPITLFCDANLIPNAMNVWLTGWKAKGWRKSNGKPVENRDLWERLDRAAEGRKVTWKWVRGHSGAEHNELADRLAYAASREAEKIVTGR